MEYICPNCKNVLYKIEDKLVCGIYDCIFQCLIEEYKIVIQPWNIQVCENASLWNNEVFDKYPYIVSKEYDRLYNLVKENKLYGAIFQIKDLFEILLKFPVILTLSRYCSNKNRTNSEDEIISFLLGKMLSLGDWYSMAQRCLHINDNSCVDNILKNITNIYEKNKIIKWRNDTLGHGALLFDDTPEFKDDLVKMLKLIKGHFDICTKDYIDLRFSYKNKGQIIQLLGRNLDCNILKSQGKLLFNYGEKEYEIKDLMKIENNGIYFFDAYIKRKKKTKMLDYVNADIMEIKLKYIDGLFRNISKRIKIEQSTCSIINDDVYCASEEDIINLIDTPEEITEPSYLKKWLEKRISSDSKGIYLLQMEEGMGKTTFTRMLDPHSKRKINFKGVATRSYYINSMYSYKVDIFKNTIIETLQMNDDMTDKIKGNIPRFINNEEISLSKQFGDILKEFRNIYLEKYNKEKILIIIDGVDEIQNVENETILDFITTYESLADNIYILITSRTDFENTEYINDALTNIQFNDKLRIYKNDNGYVNVLNEHISKKLDINNELLVNDIIKKADNRFIYIRPIEYILRYKNDKNINFDKINIFEEFLEILEDNYSEKNFKQIIELLIILAMAREELSIKEISYLLNGSRPNFKLFAYLTDISCLLIKKRTYRGTTISLSHMSLKTFVLETYSQELKKIIERWIVEIKNIEFFEISDEEKYLIFNSVYLTQEYHPTAVRELINHKNINITSIYEKFAHSNIKRYEIHLMISFMDDLIEVLQTNIKSNAKRLIIAYIFRMQVFIEYGFGGENIYINYIDRALELAERYNFKDNVMLIEAYKLRSEYYRRIGNIKKSMDDNRVIGDYLGRLRKKEIKKLELSFIDKANMLHSKSMNLKNLDQIEEAIQVALEAKAIVEDDLSIQGRFIFSDILNNLGLCYLKMDNNILAEDNIRKSISIINDINQNLGYKVEGIFYKYANLGQVLRKIKKTDEALYIYNNSIKQIKDQEKMGYLLNGNQKALQYNGRANVFLDLATIRNNEELYKSALKDYLFAVEIMENIDKDNQDLRFLIKLYLNIAYLYENIFNDIDSAQVYKSKFNDLRRKSVRIQLDLFEEEDITIDEKLNYLEGVKHYEEANKLFEKWKLDKAIKRYEMGLEAFYQLSNQDSVEIKEVLASIYYNKATCQYKLLDKKLSSDYYLEAQGKVAIKNFDKFNPLEIIDDYLKCEHAVGLDMDQKAQMYEIISNIYCEVLKRYEEAKVYAIKAIKIKEDSAEGYCALGNVYFGLNEYNEAIENYSKAIQINPNYEAAKNNLILATKMIEQIVLIEDDIQINNSKSLEKLLISELETAKSRDDSNKSEIATFYSNLGNFYFRKGSFAEAEELLKKTFNIRKVLLGMMHKDTIDSLNDLGLLYNDKKEYTKAEAMLEQVLDLSKQTLGDGHRDTIESYYNLGVFYIQNHKTQEGVDLVCKSWKLSQKVLGDTHQTTIMIRNYLEKYILPHAKIVF